MSTAKRFNQLPFCCSISSESVNCSKKIDPEKSDFFPPFLSSNCEQKISSLHITHIWLIIASLLKERGSEHGCRWQPGLGLCVSVIASSVGISRPLLFHILLLVTTRCYHANQKKGHFWSQALNLTSTLWSWKSNQTAARCLPKELSLFFWS